MMINQEKPQYKLCDLENESNETSKYKLVKKATMPHSKKQTNEHEVRANQTNYVREIKTGYKTAFRKLLENVSDRLKPGGYFVGTIPRADYIVYYYLYSDIVLLIYRDIYM